MLLLRYACCDVNIFADISYLPLASSPTSCVSESSSSKSSTLSNLPRMPPGTGSKCYHLTHRLRWLSVSLSAVSNTDLWKDLSLLFHHSTSPPLVVTFQEVCLLNSTTKFVFLSQVIIKHPHWSETLLYGNHHPPPPTPTTSSTKSSRKPVCPLVFSNSFQVLRLRSSAR